MLVIANGAPPTLPPSAAASAALRAFIGDCLHKEPASRPSAEALLAHELLADAAPDETLSLIESVGGATDGGGVGGSGGFGSECGVGVGDGGGSLGGTTRLAADTMPAAGGVACGDTLVL